MEVSLEQAASIATIIAAILAVIGFRRYSGTKIGNKVISNDQRGGITAHTVNFGKISRSVTEETIKTLHTILPQSAQKTIRIGYRGDDSESREFAYKIKTYLQESGYFVEGMNTIFAIPKNPHEINLVEESAKSIVIFIESQTQ